MPGEVRGKWTRHISGKCLLGSLFKQYVGTLATKKRGEVHGKCAHSVGNTSRKECVKKKGKVSADSVCRKLSPKIVCGKCPRIVSVAKCSRKVSVGKCLSGCVRWKV